MLQVAISRVRPDKEVRLREWLLELNTRADEVRETFRDETVRAEQAYIVAGSEGPLLIYVIEVEDYEKGANAYASSRHKIDAEHRAVMRECLLESPKLKPLYQMTLDEGQKS